MPAANLALSIREVSKRYNIARPAHPNTPGLPGLGQRIRNSAWPTRMRKEFWALQGISFDVSKGELVGIIGRNGAGKSTLLKILSRITEPTGGEIDVYGRTGSLLEVGTGFHPELTGRENVYLNGAILGMRRHEILSRFDEIVEFSGVEQFLDTPVKRYSSGMYVRLAFAVAAHLDPEILIVDEVLAVGDAEFQRRCLGKMRDVATQGRTVLFTSHNLQAVRSLCGRCVLLECGKLAMYGPTAAVVSEYIGRSGESDEPAQTRSLADRRTEYGDGLPYFLGIELLPGESGRAGAVPIGADYTVRLQVAELPYPNNLFVSALITNDAGLLVAKLSTGMSPVEADTWRRGAGVLQLRAPKMMLTPGEYWITLRAYRAGSGYVDIVDRAARFRVTPADVFGNGFADFEGLVALEHSWSVV